MSKFSTLCNYADAAAEMLANTEWDFFGNEAADTKASTSAFEKYYLRPQVLNDVSDVDVSTTILGSDIDFPVCVGPTSLNKIAHPDGEVAVARASACLNTAYVLGAWTSTSIEEVAKQTGGSLKWMQVYIYKHRATTLDLIKTAESNGFKAIVVTVDVPVLFTKYRPPATNLLISHLKLPNVSKEDAGQSENKFIDIVSELIDPSIQWKDIEWIKSNTKLPIVLKGILTEEMAKKAVDCGVAGILVSNNGTQKLKGIRPAIDCLPEVVQAVNGKCEVYLDEGIRSGSDVLKALALGAKAVFLGKLPIWALACGGEDSVRNMLLMMKDEFITTMQLMGCPSTTMLRGGEFIGPTD